VSSVPRTDQLTILLTIDVEDWFQVENFKRYIPFSSWPNCELRVERNTHRLLDLLDSHQTADSRQPSVSNCELSPMSYDLACHSNPKATFFVLGWIAKRLPHLVREIHSRGHEVASHGYYHNLCNQESGDALKNDLAGSKKLLEDIIGAPIYGYRAPSFSINDDILKMIETCGYLYDSSFNSFCMHGRYGSINLSKNGKMGIASQISDAFYELPISNLKVRCCVLPLGGGGYFRLLPFCLFRKGLETILRNEAAYMFYIHPWEVDPNQPKVKRAPLSYKLRHYVNLNKTYSKFSRIIQSFKHCHFFTCSQYIMQMAS